MWRAFSTTPFSAIAMPSRLETFGTLEIVGPHAIHRVELWPTISRVPKVEPAEHGDS